MRCKAFSSLHSSAYYILLILLNTIDIVSGVTRITTDGASYIETSTNYVLLNHVFYSQLTGTLLACAHKCLLKKRCHSFNFGSKTQEDNGLCELNDFSANKLTYREGFIHGRLLDVEIENYIFTSLGGRGDQGPTTLAQYTRTNLEGQVQLLHGIQIWKAPYTGKYVIKALGASGGNGTSTPCPTWTSGGRGASITGTFEIQRGTKLKILVGQQGLTQMNFPDKPGGGGGGTFVALYNDNTPLIVAGGGGGGGVSCRFIGNSDGDPGQVGQNGTHQGGSGGNGGNVVNLDPSNSLLAGGGAGFRGNSRGNSVGVSAKSFINGGQGGRGISGNGGFGGGGFGWTHPGGGGGYSGGGVIGNATTAFGGGGGSFNSGASQENMADVNTGNGMVLIRCLV